VIRAVFQEERGRNIKTLRQMSYKVGKLGLRDASRLILSDSGKTVMSKVSTGKLGRTDECSMIQSETSRLQQKLLNWASCRVQRKSQPEPQKGQDRAKRGDLNREILGIFIPCCRSWMVLLFIHFNFLSDPRDELLDQVCRDLIQSWWGRVRH
jgi:hypothetical protein